MKKWKVYRILKPIDDVDAVINLEEQLNNFEKGGWNIFSVSPFDREKGDFVVVLFKEQINEDK